MMVGKTGRLSTPQGVANDTGINSEVYCGEVAFHLLSASQVRISSPKQGTMFGGKSVPGRVEGTMKT